MKETTPIRWRWLKLMYAANILWAGIPGFIVTFFPDKASQYMFFAPQDPLIFSMVGSIWLSIGILSAVALRYPIQFAGILGVQILYKSIWITVIALPMIARGDYRAAPFAFFFLLMVIGFAYAVPFSYLFGNKQNRLVDSGVQVRTR